MFMGMVREKTEKIVGLKAELQWLWHISSVYKKEIFVITLISVISSIFSLSINLCLKYVIDTVTGENKAHVAFYAVVAVVLMLSNIGFSALSSRIRIKIYVRIQNELQLDVYGKIFNAQWESLREYRKGDLINRLNSDVSSIANGAIGWWPNLLSVLTQFVYSFFLIVMNDPTMALIAFISAPFSAFMSRFMIRRMHEHNLRIKELSADMMAYQTDSFGNLQYIKAFGIADVVHRKLKEKQNAFKEENLDYNKVSIVMSTLLKLAGLLVTFVSYAWGIYRLHQGAITYGTMVMFLQITLTLSGSFNALLKVIPTTINLGTSASRIMGIENLPSEDVTPTPQERQFIDESLKTGVDIRCQNVTFSYSDEPNVNILENTSFTIEKGETVAIVGGSGLGKTTFFRLLLGILSCTAGKIELENVNGDIMTANASMRELFAYVPQGNPITEATIAENIRMINPDATDEEIIGVLKMACAYDFVKELPEGIHAHIGENGKGFSEGQIQRIAIARALIKDAPVILFDEVTSALDEETEWRLLENIRTHLHNKTVIFVTHKLNTLQISDKIFKVENRKFQRVHFEVS